MYVFASHAAHIHEDILIIMFLDHQTAASLLFAKRSLDSWILQSPSMDGKDPCFGMEDVEIYVFSPLCFIHETRLGL
jgi:hypothetical protein